MKLHNACMTVCLLIALSLNMNFAHANDSKKAKALYFAAEQAYSEKKYDEALIGIKAVESLLGKSNALLQGLRVKTLYGKGDYAGTKRALDKFFTLDASEQLSREIAAYLLKAEKAIEARRIAREAAAAAAMREAQKKAEAVQIKRKAAAAKAKRQAYKKAAIRARNEALKKTGLLDLTFGGKGPDSGRSIAALPDGGFVVAGVTSLKGAGKIDAWVLRLDALGVIKWDKTIGGKKNDRASYVVVLPDGGIIVAGKSSDGKKSRSWVLRLDSEGRRVWKNDLPINVSHDVKGLAMVPGGGFIIATEYVIRRRIFGAKIFRFDGQGKLLWQKTFAPTKKYPTLSPADIVALPGGGYVVVGQALDIEPFYQRVAFVIRLDAQGRLLWKKEFAGKKKHRASDIAALPDGGFIIAGRKDGKAQLFRLDAEGRMLWENTFGANGNDHALDVAALPNGKFVVAGTTNSKGAGSYDAWVLRFDDNGRLLGEKTFGGKKSDAAYSVVARPNGWLAIAGITESKGAGGLDLWFFMTCQLTCR